MPLTDITGMQILTIYRAEEHRDFFSLSFFQLQMGDHLKLTFGNVILNAMRWRCLIWRGTYLKVNILLLFSGRTLNRRVLGSSQATTRVAPEQMDMFAIWRARRAPHRWPPLPFCFCPSEGVTDKRYLVSAGVPGWRALSHAGGHQPRTASPPFIWIMAH